MTGEYLAAGAMLLGIVLAALNEHLSDRAPRDRNIKILRASAKQYAQMAEDEMKRGQR
jgi:hypothetical protein